MNEDELLRRIALSLKQEIGPAIEDDYPKTQAFMAAVVLEKLGRQLALAAQHRAAEAADLRALQDDLRDGPAGGKLPEPVAAALGTLAATPGAAALCALIEALYRSREELGAARFTQLLGRVRQTLRASIDRRMEYAA